MRFFFLGKCVQNPPINTWNCLVVDSSLKKKHLNFSIWCSQINIALGLRQKCCSNLRWKKFRNTYQLALIILLAVSTATKTKSKNKRNEIPASLRVCACVYAWHSTCQFGNFRPNLRVSFRIVFNFIAEIDSLFNCARCQCLRIWWCWYDRHYIAFCIELSEMCRRAHTL